MNVNSKSRVTNTPVGGPLRNLSPKTTVMIALLAIMGILWGRVLLSGQKGPTRAEAMGAAAIQETVKASDSTPLEIERISLPEMPGRNDRLSCNFFSSNNWQDFNPQHENEQKNDYEISHSNESIERSEQLKLEQIAKRLILEAVIEGTDGNSYQAYVDGKILSVGNTLTVQEGPDQYVLMVKKISEKEVVFSWNQASVVLKIPESFEM